MKGSMKQHPDEDAVVLVNQCLGVNRLTTERCKIMLPRGEHFCLACRPKTGIHGKRGGRPYHGASHRGNLLSGESV